MRGYYFITDRNLSRLGNLSDAGEAIKAGARVVQYREKNVSTKEMFEEALKLREICKEIIFLVNDRIDIAKAVNADGVHIGKSDMPYQAARKLMGKNKIIGVTVHNVNDAKEAQKQGADYIGLSPIFETSTKPDAKNPVGIEMIREVKKHVRLPLVAIGGINLQNAAQIIAAGADCICAISAVVAKKNVKQEIEKFQKLF
jgi:thiamine-phosphate pyrophosphorylase